MIIVSEILTAGYRKLGRPSQADMPYQDLLDIARDVIRENTLDLKLMARNHTNTAGGWVTPTDSDMTASGFTSGLDNIVPVKMEWRPTGSDSTLLPLKAEIVSYEALGDLARISGQTYVAFYNGWQSIAFSETAETLAQREYRLIYEDMEDISALTTTSTAQIPAIFVTFCQDDVAFRALDYVENPSEAWAEKRERLRPNIVRQYIDNKTRFIKWGQSLLGNKKIHKVGAGRRRY
jgi:hypothetical protein